MFSLQACVLRELKWLGKFSMNGGAALSYGSFSDSSVFTLTKDAFFAQEVFLSENVVSSESSICGKEKGTCPL